MSPRTWLAVSAGGSLMLVLACVGGGTTILSEPAFSVESLQFAYMTTERWVSSENLQIAVNSQDGESDGITRRISPEASVNYNFGNFERCPK